MQPQNKTAAPGLQPRHGSECKRAMKPLAQFKNHKAPPQASSKVLVAIRNDEGHFVGWSYFASPSAARAHVLTGARP